METITNAASTVGSTVSNLIYGQPAKDNEPASRTATNETAGKEPLSGQQGKGTLDEPYDQGNAENPVDTASKTNTFPSNSNTSSTTGNTSYSQGDFLKLNPTLGESSATEPTTNTTTGATSETSMPIVPLNPNSATSGIDKTSTTNDKTGVTDKVWKPTALDEVKPEGAPGAGPPAPNFTPATPDTNLTSATSSKTSDPTAPDSHGTDGAKDSTISDKDTKPKDGAHNAPAPKTENSVGGDIDAILDSTPKSKHSVNDSEAQDPHSKMTGQTVRQTEAAKTGEGKDSKSLVSEKAGHKGHSGEPSSTAGEDDDDEKTGKMSQLKDKLKDKLHIGSKDK